MIFSNQNQSPEIWYLVRNFQGHFFDSIFPEDIKNEFQEISAEISPKRRLIITGHSRLSDADMTLFFNTAKKSKYAEKLELLLEAYFNMWCFQNPIFKN